MCRLLTLTATHKVHVTKVAPYLVADYVTELQKVTLLPRIKVKFSLCIVSQKNRMCRLII